VSPGLQRTLAFWAALLAAGLCLLFLPVSRSVAVVLMLCWWALIIVVLAARPRPAQEDALCADDLPDTAYRQPVVLVCGDSAQAWPDDASVLTVAHGCWVRVARHQALDAVGRQLLSLRPEWGRQLSVTIGISPQQHQDYEALTSQLLTLRWQLEQLRRETGYSVPLVLCGQVGSAMIDEPLWQAAMPDESVRVWRDSMAPCTLSSWLAAGGYAAWQQQVLFNSLTTWLQRHVEAVFADGARPVYVVRGLSAAIDGGASPSSLWIRWMQQHSALNRVNGWLPAGSSSLSSPLPECVLPLLPEGGGLTPPQRACRYGLGLFVIVAIVALCSSAWNNRQLVQRIAFDINDYQRIAMDDYAPKAAAVEVLRQDAAGLDNYARNGVPLRLGLGLYQGGRLQRPLLEAIRAWVPPPPPPAPVAEKVPETVRLDSLSLFDTGKAVLKPGSLKLLVNALVDIKARPGWLIVVAGHTDSTGEAQANQQLSLKRAEALRDWMLQTSDVSPTCFAVQGFGASRPIATNATPAGRALNRRVEISLVPQANACLAADHPQTSSQDDDITANPE